MKLPEYALKQDVPYGDSFNKEVFPAGTLVFPFWNETLLPDHRKEDLKKERKYLRDGESDFVYCIIGTIWVIVRKECIRENK